MGIALEYRAGSLPEGPESADVVSLPSAALETTCFETWVRFAVDGVELLAYPGVSPDWRRVPLLGFATILRGAVLSLGRTRTARMALSEGGMLRLDRTGDVVTLSSSLIPEQAKVAAMQLEAETNRFAREACEVVRSVAPTIAEHPNWPRWSGGPRP